MKFDVNEDKMDNCGMDYHSAHTISACLCIRNTCSEHMFCRHTLQLLEVHSVCLKNKSVCEVCVKCWTGSEAIEVETLT